MAEDAGQKSCATCRFWRWGLALTLAAIAAVWWVGE